MSPKVLVVLSSSGSEEIDHSGWFLSEFAHPYHVLAPHCDITVASPKGGHAICDPFSVGFAKDDEISMDFWHNHKDVWADTKKIHDVLGHADDFDAVFYPGGHGPVIDLYRDADSQQLIGEFAQAGKVVSAICHGPAALLYVKNEDGTPLLKGAKVTSCTDDEERALGTDKHIPFFLETELRKVASEYDHAPELWGSCVVVDRGGKLITGENPASGAGVAEEILKQIKQ